MSYNQFEDWTARVNKQSIGQCWITNQPINRELAIRIAKQTFCPSLCGQCSNCKIFQNEEHPDFHFVQSDDGHNVKVDVVRNLAKSIHKRPLSSHHIVIFSRADTLTESGYHALLKTLEESDHAWFLLGCVNMTSILATIRSRCQVLYSRDSYEASDSEEDSQLWHTHIHTQPYKVLAGWQKQQWSVDTVTQFFLTWIVSQFRVSRQKKQWSDAFDEVTHWHSLYRSKGNMSDALMLERFAILASRLFLLKK